MVKSDKTLRTVLVNGTFDILHRGHVELLDFAQQQGGYLIVAIDSDRRVQELKGPMRPVNCEKDRRFLLEHLHMVDEVIIFDTDADLIDIVRESDVVVKGSDYRDRDFFERIYCRELIFFDRLDGYSTTETIQKSIAHRR